MMVRKEKNEKKCACFFDAEWAAFLAFSRESPSALEKKSQDSAS